jgi:hypothetical protein
VKQSALRCTYTPKHVQHKSEPILDTANLLLNMGCSSASIESLLVKEKLRTQPLRPQLNIFLQARSGSLKTTILEEIGHAYNVTPYSYVTYPAMIGSIDRTTGRVITGLAWEARRKPLLLDEFRTGERGDAGAIDVLLGVTETGHYKRRIALTSETFREEDGDLYYSVRDGEIEVQTRFPCIIATMRNLDMSRSDRIRALIQRCIPIKYDLPDEVVDAALNGSLIFRLGQYSPPKQVVINGRDYARIMRVTQEIRQADSSHKFREVYSRAVGDLCRIFAILGKHDVELYRLVCYLKAGQDIRTAIDSAEEGEVKEAF